MIIRMLISLYLCLVVSQISFSAESYVANSLIDALILSKESKKDIVLIFGADWCKYCNILKKDIENHSEIIIDKIIVYSNIDKDSELAQEYQVKSIPDCRIIRNNIEISRKIGYLGIKDFTKWLETNK